MEQNKVYTFNELEEFLNEWENVSKCLIVKNNELNQNAFMHVFGENFSEGYQSGDGILFYNDGDACSADHDTEFTVIDIVTL